MEIFVLISHCIWKELNLILRDTINLAYSLCDCRGFKTGSSVEKMKSISQIFIFQRYGVLGERSLSYWYKVITY